MNFAVSGSIGINHQDIRNTYNLYLEGTNESNKVLKILNSKYETEYSGEPYWQKQDNNPNILKEIVIDTKTADDAISEALEVIKKEATYGTQTPFVSSDADVFLAKSNKDEENLCDYIIDIIKEKHLFSSGHYHWDKNIRTHASINTDRLLGNYIYMDRIKNYMYHYIINEHCDDTELLIGYSMQGNVLGSVIATEMNCKYTYYPNIGRKHGEYEKILPNEDVLKRITIIFDVIYSGNSLRKLVRVLTEKYSNLEVINVCSIFYTNSCEYDVNLFSTDTNEKFYIDSRVKFYSACNIKIAGCPYEDVHKCLIYNNQLEKVNVFYSEEDENADN